jgi:hypothetical protein
MSREPYSSIPGWATVVEVRDADPHAYNLPDAVEVVFDFEPDEPGARQRYEFPEAGDAGQRLTVGSGANPPRRWAAQMGLRPGSRHRCVRRERRHGVSTPVIFDFPDVDTTTEGGAYQEGQT